MFDLTTPPLGCRPDDGREDIALRLSANPLAVIPSLLLVSSSESFIHIEQFPYCLAFTVTISNDPRYLMSVLDGATENGQIVFSLQAARHVIILTMNGTSVTFLLPNNATFTSHVDDVVHLQICVNSAGVPTLYVNCEAAQTASVNLPQPETSHSLYVFLNNATTPNLQTIFVVGH